MDAVKHNVNTAVFAAPRITLETVIARYQREHHWHTANEARTVWTLLTSRWNFFNRRAPINAEGHFLFFRFR